MSVRFKVATYFEPRGEPKKAHVRAYTRDYHPSWEGYMLFEVEAASGKEAKRKAIALRVEHETQNWIEAHL